jgi:hypothetical protein
VPSGMGFLGKRQGRAATVRPADGQVISGGSSAASRISPGDIAGTSMHLIDSRSQACGAAASDVQRRFLIEDITLSNLSLLVL